MFISAINNTPKASFGHIYSQAVDTVLKNYGPSTKKEEAKLYDTVSRASRLHKSVITSSFTKGFVLLTAGESGKRNIYKTFPVSEHGDFKSNFVQLEKAVKEAEQLEKTSLPKINPIKDGISSEAAKGIPDNLNYNRHYIYDKTINGYKTDF